MLVPLNKLDYNNHRYEIELKTVFGNPIKIEHYDQEIDLDELKRKFASKVGFSGQNKDIVIANGDTICKNNEVLATRKYIKSKNRKSISYDHKNLFNVEERKPNDLLVLFGNINLNKNKS
jgi:hypothetical protein